MAYVDPCIEIVARGRRVTATALNDRGQVLLPVIGAAMHRAALPGAALTGLRTHPPGRGSARVTTLPATMLPVTMLSVTMLSAITLPGDHAAGHHAAGDHAAADRADREASAPWSSDGPGGTFTEEERSRQPTVFSALREIIAAFSGPDPHLGLYGAFGYDLAFQFEPVRQRHDRGRRPA